MKHQTIHLQSFICYKTISTMNQKLKHLDTIFLMILFKVCGMATCSFSNVEFLQKGGYPHFVPSRSAKLYNIFLIVVQLLIVIIPFLDLSGFEIVFTDKVTTVTFFSDFGISFLAAFSVLVLYTVRQKLFVNIINRLVEFDIRMSSIVKVPLEKQYSYNCPIIFLHFLIIVLVMVVNYANYDIGFFAVAFQVSYLLVHMHIYQYGFIVRAIQTRLKLINLTLTSLFVENEKVVEIVAIDVDSDDKFGKELLLVLRKSHSELCEIAKIVTDFYAPSFICCAVSCLYGTTNNLFTLVRTIFYWHEYYVLVGARILSLWMLFFPIVFLSMAVTNCSTEVCILFF